METAILTSDTGIPGMVSYGNVSSLMSIDGSLLGLTEYNLGVTEMSTSQTDSGDTNTANTDALLYIVVVLGFYALAMVVLMVKYVRRENQESELTYYFSEFIKRDSFNCAKYQNQRSVKAMKEALASRRTLSTHLRNPVVTWDGYVQYNSNTPSDTTTLVEDGTTHSNCLEDTGQLLQSRLDRRYVLSTSYNTVQCSGYTAAHGDVEGLPPLIETPCDENGLYEREHMGDLQSAV